MNGRVYDPMLGRMLSVDPIFAFPTNTQSLNPYSYVLNNPLSLTDPSGYTSQQCSTGQTCPDDSGFKPGQTAQTSYTPTGSRIATTVTATVKSDGSVAISSNNPAVAKSIASNAAAMFGGGNGAENNSQASNSAQNKPTDTAGINSPSQTSKQLSPTSQNAIENANGFDDAKAFEKRILDASAKNNIDPNILVGLDFRESSLDPSTPGGGLFQIQAMKKVLGLSDDDIKDPGKQINAVAGALADNLKTFRGNSDLAIAAWTLGVPHTEKLFAKGGIDAVRNTLLNKNHPEQGRVGPQYIDKIKEFEEPAGDH